MRRTKEESTSFLKKRSKKLLPVCARSSDRASSDNPKVFGAFFQKSTLAFFLIATAATAQTSPKPHKAAPEANPFLTGDRASMPVTTWFSLGPQREDFGGAAYDKDAVTGGLRANESITVYARRHVVIPEDNQPGTLGEPAHSDAAQPVVPRMGEGCSRFTVCVDPSQKGLFSSVFGN